MKLKFIVAVVLVGSTLLTACGKGGGGSSNASAPAASAFSGSPTGWIGNGTWRGAVTVTDANRAAYLQMAALTGVCSGQGCMQSYFNLTIRLRSNGNMNPYPVQGQVPTAGGFSTTADFAMRGGVGQNFSRSNVELGGNSTSFQLRNGLYSNFNGGVPTPPAAGEPTIQINGQFQDASQTVVRVQVLFNGALVGEGTLTGNNNNFPGIGGNVNYEPGFGGSIGGGGSGLILGGSYRRSSGYICVGSICYSSNRNPYY